MMEFRPVRAYVLGGILATILGANIRATGDAGANEILRGGGLGTLVQSKVVKAL